jgi:hypothetical protein
MAAKDGGDLACATIAAGEWRDKLGTLTAHSTNPATPGEMK